MPCLSLEAGEPNCARVELFSLDPAPGGFLLSTTLGQHRGIARPETRTAKLKSAIISTVLWPVIAVPFCGGLDACSEWLTPPPADLVTCERTLAALQYANGH